VSGKIVFAEATPADEGEIRRLLRENPIGGAFPVSLEREPNGLGGPHLAGERSCFILARETAGGPAIGLCERVVRPAFVNGEERLLPYLGALRIAASHRRRIAILKGGFAALREHSEQPDECSFALTSITTDNSLARRVLTADLAGLPTYRPMNSYATLILRTRRSGAGPGIRLAQEEDLPGIALFLQGQLRRRQLAPCWSEDDLRRLDGAQFLVAGNAGQIAGCICLWDQRASRQAVVRGYPAMFRRLRPVINLVAPLLGTVDLPPVGTALSQAFLSHLAVRDDGSEMMLALVGAALGLAASRGLAAAIVGMPASHHWRWQLKKKFRAFEYLTQLYLVHWPEDEKNVSLSSDAVLFPDVGLL
jgi:hypothetical protein